MTFTAFRRMVSPMEEEDQREYLKSYDDKEGFLCKKRSKMQSDEEKLFDPLVHHFKRFVAMDVAQGLEIVRITQDALGNKTRDEEECLEDFETENINRITSYIDGSQIYGTTFHVSTNLRTMSDGLLKINDNDVSKFIQNKEGENEMNLAFIMTLFKLEHNRLAVQIKEAFKEYGVILGKEEDETIYQESRRILVAVLQHIIYDEYLPVILGPETVHRFELSSKKNTYYDRNINPAIFDGFLSAFVYNLNQSCEREEYKEKREDNNDPWTYKDLPDYVSVFRHRPKSIIGYYKDYRRLCGLTGKDIALRTWNELLVRFHNDTDRIDLYSGGISEKPLSGRSIGPTFACLIAYQFHLLKTGDRRFYSHVREGFPARLDPKSDKTLIHSLQKPKPRKRQVFVRHDGPKYYMEDPNLSSFRDAYRFNYDEIDEIRHRTLGGILCDNYHYKSVKRFAFYRDGNRWNSNIRCGSIIPFTVRTFMESSHAYQIKK